MAWTLGAKKDQVIRASTGIMYDQPLLAVYENAIQQNGLPARTTYSVNAAGIGAPAFPNTLSNLPAGAVLPAQTIFAPDPDLKLAYNIQNSAQYARGFGRSYNGSIGVVYNRGYNLPVITDINLINPIGHARRRPRHLQRRRSTPRRAWIRASTTSTWCSRPASRPTRRCC